MIRPFRLFATLAAALALTLGVTARLVRAESATAPAVSFRGAAPAHGHGADDDAEYRLDKLPILSRVILNVKDNYVDPSRFDPKQMVVSALESVEKTVAEVMVQGDARSPKLTVTAGPTTQEFDISGVKTIWDVRTVLGKVMGFIQENLVAHKDLKEIEYAAVNGMLSTLDPHSVLLEPKFFKEMKLQTRGEFGGLGFVIAMRDGNLTVVKVLKKTPAQRAGIKGKDVITKIEEQSTVNMDLQDAVDHLRGKPQTRVAITISRAGWPEPKRFQLSREMITVETVPQSKLLDGGVGYVKLSQFSANTTRDLAAAIADERQQAGGTLKGLVLDLRGNPGGLLEQAIQVSDLFLSSGVIVKTVGEGDRQRIHEVKEASADPEDMTALPMVVIVNGSSASASEIVAGALKNNNRALVVGRQTFGKGSVQVLYDFNEPGRSNEEAALKLTIAQYLTPGDISIQETGITPDVALFPGRALKDAVNVFAPPRSMGEADLEHHFSNPADGAGAAAAVEKKEKRRIEKAPLELHYLLDEKEDAVAKAMKREEAAARRNPHGDDLELTPEQQEDEDSEANPDDFAEDYQVRFARDLLARAPYPERPRLLEAARAFVAERKTDEDARLAKRLGELGVDWTPAPAGGGTPRASVSVSPAAGHESHAGDTLHWAVTVENRGDAPFRRLRAWTVDEKNPLLDRREFVFGTVRPGERRSWSVPVKLPRGMDSRRDEVTLHFEDDGGKAPPDSRTTVDVVEVPKPIFAFSVQLDDQKGGNGDGLPQRGESFTVRVAVKNEGPGASGEKTYVSLKNLGDEKLFIKKGRESIGALKPGEVKWAAMEVELKKGSKSDTLPVRVMVVDEKMDQYVSEKLDIPVAKEEPARAPATGAVAVQAADAFVRAGASPGAEPLASARKGAVLPVDGKFGDFYRVEWQRGRFGFVADADVKPSHAPHGGAVAELWQREPPRIALVPDPIRGAPVAEGDKWRLQGSAFVPPSADPDARLRDLFVFVNDQKVFFKVVPESANAAKLDFSTDVPLKPGNNTVTVVAREDDEFQTRRSVVVFSRAPAEMATDTRPKAAVHQ